MHRRSTGPVGAPTLPDLREDGFSTESTAAHYYDYYMIRYPREHPPAPTWGQPARSGCLGTTHQRPDAPWQDQPPQRASTLAHATIQRRTPVVKFRVERDVLADAVAWAARSPADPPQRAGAGRPADRGSRSTTAARACSSRRSTTRPRPAPPSTPTSTDEGRALVSGRLLADICRSLPSKTVEMAIDGPKVVLTCGSARFSLQTMPVEDYPTLPDMPEAPGTVPSDVFANAVSQAVTAAGRDDMLPVLTGVRHGDRGSNASRCWPPTGSGSPSRELTGRRAPPTVAPPRWSRPRCSPTPRSR